jgi:hypothetical protein
MVDLTTEEIAIQLHALYDGLADIVELYLKNGDNPGVRLKPFASGYTGPTHYTIAIEGLITGPNKPFMDAVEELAPGANYKNDTLPDGRPIGWKVHLPYVKKRPVKSRGGTKLYGGSGRQYAAARQNQEETPSVERITLLWVLTTVVGALIYYRAQSGLLY